ncbi:MAG: hypothetical protein Q4C96_11380 [Planctomycetia bacterium]|nr:hypothetical protein [Planctomycetia bacterium]
MDSPAARPFLPHVLRHFIRDYAYAPSTAPGKSNHGETSFGNLSGTTDFVLRPRLRENRTMAERRSVIYPGLRTSSFVHGSGKIETWRNVVR